MVYGHSHQNATTAFATEAPARKVISRRQLNNAWYWSQLIARLQGCHCCWTNESRADRVQCLRKIRERLNPLGSLMHNAANSDDLSSCKTEFTLGRRRVRKHSYHYHKDICKLRLMFFFFFGWNMTMCPTPRSPVLNHDWKAITFKNAFGRERFHILNRNRHLFKDGARVITLFKYSSTLYIVINLPNVYIW
jgi:hypothetical protein